MLPFYYIYLSNLIIIIINYENHMKMPMICMVQAFVPSVKGGIPTIIMLAFKIVLCCIIRYPLYTRSCFPLLTCCVINRGFEVVGVHKCVLSHVCNLAVPLHWSCRGRGFFNTFLSIYGYTCFYTVLCYPIPVHRRAAS